MTGFSFSLIRLEPSPVARAAARRATGLAVMRLTDGICLKVPESPAGWKLPADIVDTSEHTSSRLISTITGAVALQ